MIFMLYAASSFNTGIILLTLECSMDVLSDNAMMLIQTTLYILECSMGVLSDNAVMLIIFLSFVYEE